MGERSASRTGLALSAVIVAAVGWFSLRGWFAGEAQPQGTALERLRADDRLSVLLFPCDYGKTFQGDTSDAIGILVRRLEQGTLEPLRRARMELAEIGEPAIPELRRLFDDAYADQWRHGVVENVLGCLTLMEEPYGLPILRDALGHPLESVRLAALDGLAVHGEPADYDTVAAWLPIAVTLNVRSNYALCMFTLDPERFCAELAGWMEEGTWPGLWEYGLAVAVDPQEPETVARYRALAETAQPLMRPYLLVSSARGDAEVLAELRAMLGDERQDMRRAAIDAFTKIGMEAELLEALEEEPAQEVRVIIAGAVAGMETTEGTVPALERSLNDGSEKVREICLGGLLERGSERAVGEVLSLVSSGIRGREIAMRALGGRWDSNPGAAERVFALLERLFEENREGSGRISILQAIGQVPGRRSAELLMEVGRTFEGNITGIPAHRWCALQAFNSGPAGWAYLKESLAAETDPIRRIDLLWSLANDRSDDTRAVFREIVLDPDTHPYELLFAAASLVKLGPTSEAAPLVKRVYLGNSHPEVRPALQCLLWTWYR